VRAAQCPAAPVAQWIEQRIDTLKDEEPSSISAIITGVNEEVPRLDEFAIARRVYESVMKREGKSPSTLKTYGRFLDSFGSWLGGRGPGAITTLLEIESYLDEWLAVYVERYGKEPSSNTIRNHESALSSFYDALTRRGLCSVNPVTMKRPKPVTKKGDHLSADEFNALLAAPVTPQERVIVAIYAWTGSRSAEILQAAQGDVDLENRRIRIRHSKTTAGQRVLPLLPELQLELQLWFKYLADNGRRDDRLPILATKNLTPMYHTYTWRVVKRVAARGNVRKQEAPDKAGENVSTMTIHTLRRTLAALLLNGYAGNEAVRVEAMSAFLGHNDVRTTLAYYAEVQQETMASEVLKGVGAF
jgi:integrase